MKHTFSILIICATALACPAEESETPQLARPGEAVEAVRSRLGEPHVEFPLKGLLVQDYGACIITSSNGVVVAIKELEQPIKEQPQEGMPSSISLKELKTKAEAGESWAQYCLGYCYQSGNAVEVDMDEAVRWYTRAAMNGHAAAQHNLGVIFLKGEGVEKDLEQAYTWARLAADNGNDLLLQVLRPVITDEQERGGRLRADRIREGLEKDAYRDEAATALARRAHETADVSTE